LLAKEYKTPGPLLQLPEVAASANSGILPGGSYQDGELLRTSDEGVPGNAEKALVVPLHNPFSASLEAALSGISSSIRPGLLIVIAAVRH
jgi:hypothetical protein